MAKTIAKSRRHLDAHLDRLEDQLEKSGGPWILGEAYTLADVGWLVIFERLRQADFESVFLATTPGGERHPRTAAYWARLRERPAYAAAIEGHSHPLIEYGRERIVQAKQASPTLRACLEGA